MLPQLSLLRSFEQAAN